MRRMLAMTWAALAACGMLAGCTIDQYARILIEQDTTYGKINEGMVGSSRQLVESQAISAARRYKTPDGTEIDVWVLKPAQAAAARGTVLVLHGLCDSKVTHLRLGRLLAAKGFHVVLPDLRGHGRSSGKCVTFGALEREDQRHVIDALLREKTVAEPLYVFGADIGGTVGILYAAGEPRVQGVVAVAPSKDIRSLAARFFSRNAILLKQDELDRVIARAGRLGHFDPDEASALAAAARLRCPLLLVHGKLDIIVPFTDSQEIYAAAQGPKALDLIPWANHFGVLFAREANILRDIEKVVTGRLGTTTRPAGKPPASRK